MKLFSPDGQLCVEAGLESQAGRKWCAFRVMLGRHVLVARSTIAAPSEPTGEVETRELVGRGGVILARELTIRYRGGRCIFRVVDDAFAVFPVGRGIQAVPRFASTLSRGYSPSVAKDGSAGCETLTPAKCRRLGKDFSALLFYSTGKCSAVVANSKARGFIMTVASRPVDAVLPRGLRHLLRGLPQSIREQGIGNRERGTGIRGQGSGIRGLGSGIRDQRTGVRGYGALSTSSVDAFFLNFGYIFDALSEVRPLAAQRGGTPHLPLRPKAAIRGGTPAHKEAFAILADPARGEAVAGFRGEMGEYVCGARRNGRVWLVAGITEKLRVLTLFFPYLEEGVRYRATWTLDEGADLPTNAVNPTPVLISAGDKAMVRMNPDGGFVLRLEPLD